jgi:serine/threonine protein phosphatase PrpC
MDPRASIWSHCLDYAALSDVGMRRANNQDSMAVALAGSQELWFQRGHLFMVADGMGAHAAGELASRLAADSIPLSYQKLTDLPAPEALRRSVQEANDLIHRRGQASDDFRGMGTTSTALLLLPQGAVTAHVGDSRAYRLRGVWFDQLTFDHSLIWEMKAAGQSVLEQFYVPKNIITRSLGPNPTVQVDLEGPFPLEVGDTFLLCSDGLSGQVKDQEMGQILACLPPAKAVRLLVDLANLRGGPDNITVIVARVTAPQVAQGTTPGTLQKNAGRQRPIHPVMWGLMGLFALAAVVTGAMGQWLGAVIGVLLTLATSALAILLRGQAEPSPEPGNTPPLGRGPYVRCDARPDAEFVDNLARTLRELREAATQEQWVVDWNTINELQTRGDTSRQAGSLGETIVHYGGAISFMMEQLRRQSGRAPNDE